MLRDLRGLLEREQVTPRQRLLGDHVRDHSHQAGLSQEALALKAGVNPVGLRVPRGRSTQCQPGNDLSACLAIAFGCDATDLVRGTQAKRARATEV